MIVDNISREEILDALRIYSTLHGLCTVESSLQARVTSFLANQPDDQIDLAIVAYQEDRMVAPPDIVIPQWGKSRYYRLKRLPQGGSRHEVYDAWFENSCSLAGLVDESTLLHFWTEFSRQRSSLNPKNQQSVSEYLHRGLRLRLRLADETHHVEVHHRDDGIVGALPTQIAEEIAALSANAARFLPLVDAIYEQADGVNCKMIVILAGTSYSATEIAEYAEEVFFADRAAC